MIQGAGTCGRASSRFHIALFDRVNNFKLSRIESLYSFDFPLNATLISFIKSFKFSRNMSVPNVKALAGTELPSAENPDIFEPTDFDVNP